MTPLPRVLPTRRVEDDAGIGNSCAPTVADGGKAAKELGAGSVRGGILWVGIAELGVEPGILSGLAI